MAVVIDLLTVLAMFARNLIILAIFAPTAVRSAAPSLVVMALVSLAFLWQQKRRSQNQIGELKLSSPLSLSKVFKFGLIFLLIDIVGSLGHRYFGHLGFFVVSLLGGLVSSASTTGAAATLAMHGAISPQSAGLATVLTSMTSALSNLPLLHQEVRRWELTRKLIIVSSVVVLAGLLTMLLRIWF